jgi:hypothetical protein
MTAAPCIPDDSAPLTNGSRMPLLGFGTWQIKGEDAVRATSVALETGYRHLDTATVAASYSSGLHSIRFTAGRTPVASGTSSRRTASKLLTPSSRV